MNEEMRFPLDILEGAFKVVLSRSTGAFRKIVINKKSGKEGE